MIEGSEELKAYIYEAASFPRVDLAMYEGNNYHSMYMAPPRLTNWTKTHGGPYYVEVGKNIHVEYVHHYNTTFLVKVGNDTVNQTSIATKIMNWTYYSYEMSQVEYYYYKDCVIVDMLPHSALTTGGTRFVVVGAWFKYMPEYGVVPHCKFGDKIVRAVFDSTVRIVCTAPPT